MNLSVNLNKPIIPLLMEKMAWPPAGAMGPIFGEYLFIRFFARPGEGFPDKDPRYWPRDKFTELLMQIRLSAAPDHKTVAKGLSRVVLHLCTCMAKKVSAFTWFYMYKMCKFS